MSALHTPGPWKLNHRGDEVMGASGSTVGLTLAKVTQFVPEYRASSDANARLMAAAPSLLEALEGMVMRFSGKRTPEAETAIAAIRLAKGGAA